MTKEIYQCKLDRLKKTTLSHVRIPVSEYRNMLELLVAMYADSETSECLLKGRTALLKAIPPCPQHGECVPHALEWIAKKSQSSRKKKL